MPSAQGPFWRCFGPAPARATGLATAGPVFPPGLLLPRDDADGSDGVELEGGDGELQPVAFGGPGPQVRVPCRAVGVLADSILLVPAELPRFAAAVEAVADLCVRGFEYSHVCQGRRSV